MFGLQCDRTGATQTVGVFLCPGYHDYIALVNSKGGVEGYKIRVLEIDHEYKVPPAMEAHERFKKEGAVLDRPLRHAADRRADQEAGGGQDPRHLAGLRHGRGSGRQALSPTSSRSRPATGRRQPAAVAFVKKELGGNLKGKKIAYLFYDNPAGKEPLVILEDLAKTRRLRAAEPSPCRRPASRWRAQVLDITGRFKPDFVITHLFGRSPSVSIKELKGKGYPLSKVISFVWGASEADIKAAGGYERGRTAITPSSSPASARTSRSSRTSTRCTRPRASRCRRRRRSASSTTAAS